MKVAFAVLSVLAFVSLVAAADPEPFLKSAPMPFYPPLARQARIEGTVKLRATVNQDGDISNIEALSGHLLLRNATVEYVKSWKFGWQHPCACTVQRDVTFVYKISEKEASPDSPVVVVKWFGMDRVEIETNPPHVETMDAY